MEIDFKLQTGQVVCTKAVNDVIEQNPVFAEWVFDCFSRHIVGDWGDLTKSDKKSNEEALEYGHRVLSAYKFPNEQKIDTHTKIYIITEADRSATTILFPSEY